MVDSVQYRAADVALGHARPELLKTSFIALQLGLLLLAVRQFGIQDTAFRYTLALTLPGFLIHALLPARYRSAFFVVLSVAAVFLVLGLGAGAWVLGLGGVLIAICYAPAAFYARVAALVALAAVFAAARIGWLDLPVPAVVWPVLASMFMFRMIVYLYDTGHDPNRQPLTRTLSYFFMLPNACFPLFPVVDYKRFCRSDTTGEQRHAVYQRGIHWMLRGVIHLLLYRFVYQSLALDPATAVGMTDALQFSFSAFLLYFQVSGTFHLIVGMLLLFGFDLPETHHKYFLASSFNDFWRRINIYWKDFMMKLFYYPVYFRVRRAGDRVAIVVSTLFVFAGTWLLHAYQWFWLRGSLLIEWNDFLFWAVLAVLVVGNSLYEHRYGRARQLAGSERNWLDRMSGGLATAATFITIGLLWGMWSSDDIQQWAIMWETTDGRWMIFTVLIPALYAASLVLGHVSRRLPQRAAGARPRLQPAPAPFWRLGVQTLSGIVLLAAVGTVQIYSTLPEPAVSAIEDLRTARLNARSEGQMIRGYYEELADVNRNVDGLWGMGVDTPAGWGEPSRNDVTILTNDLRIDEYAPNVSFMISGSAVTTNEWGMRDGSYALEKPAGALRIAVLGASHVFGRGVAGADVFEALVEERLNASPDDAIPPVEMLNFAHSAKGPVRQAVVLEKKIVPFAPDVLLFFGHRADANRSVVDLDLALEAGVDLESAELEAIARKAQWTASEAPHLRRQRLARFRYQLLDWAYARMAAICREHGIRPIYVYLPFTGDRGTQPVPEEELAAPARNGFTIWMDLEDVFAGHTAEELGVAAWDGHPNALGHRLIADRLYEVLSDRLPALAPAEGAPSPGSAHGVE